MLLMTTCVVPVLGEFIAQSTDATKDTNYVPLNDAVFDLKISFFMKIAGYPSLAACIIKDDQIVWSKGYGGIMIVLNRNPQRLKQSITLVLSPKLLLAPLSCNCMIKGCLILMMMSTHFYRLTFETQISLMIPSPSVCFSRIHQV